MMMMMMIMMMMTTTMMMMSGTDKLTELNLVVIIPMRSATCNTYSRSLD